jgi:uncharacterized protein YbaP (TraB family)
MKWLANPRRFRVLASLLYALVVSVSSWAGETAAQLGNAFSAITPRVHTNGLFWKIERSGYRPSYLLGTIHIADPSVTVLSSVIARVFREADTVCTEVKMDYETLAAEMKAMFFHDGQNLKVVTGDRLYDQVLAASRVRGIPESMLINMKPWALAYMLSVPQQQGGEVLDMKLYTDAVRQGKVACGLETAAEHGKVFDNLSMEEQVAALRQTVQNMDVTEHLFQQLHGAYLARDLAALVRVSSATPWADDPSLAAKLVRSLIIDRNQVMVTRMAPYLKSGNAFFAVGALHLTGEKGILRLLEERGYRVTALE